MEKKPHDNVKIVKDHVKQPGNLIGVLILIVLIAGLIGFALWLNRPAEDEVSSSASRLNYEKAVVTAVLADDAVPDYSNAEGRRVGTQELEIRILTGSHKDEIMHLTNSMSALFNVDVKKGDRIIVRLLTDETGSCYASLFNYNRGTVLGILVLVFLVLLIVLGGKKGLGAVLGLLFTLGSIWFILIPCLIRGIPAIAVTVGIVAATTAASLIFLNGFSKKALCSALGCIIGVVAAGAIAALVGHVTPLNGFNMPEAENLLLYGADKGLKISGLMVCGVLISSLGAVMDVALGLASSVWEMHALNPSLRTAELFRSGMHVGRDAMGTMANTLILAFAGSSLNMLILVQTYGIPFIQLVNTDYLCIEVIQSVSGATGLLLTVPIVAFISAWLMASEKHVSKT